MNLHFSENLRRYLKSSGLSLKDLGKELEVPTSTIHGWLNGIPPRSIIKIKKISNLLKCTVDELCFDEKKEKLNERKKLESSLEITLGDERYQVVLIKIAH